MFRPREHQRDDLIAAALVASLPPADDIHAGLSVALGDGQGTVEALAEEAVGLFG